MANRFYILAFLGMLGLAALAQAQTFTTLYSFARRLAALTALRRTRGCCRSQTGISLGRPTQAEVMMEAQYSEST